MEGRDAMADAVRSTARLTYDDLVAMFPEDDGVHRELIGGEIFVTPSAVTRHQRLSMRLALSLGNHLDLHPNQGEVFTARFDVVLTAFDVVEPDVLVILGDQRNILTDKNVRGAPGIVIEILSPGTRKRDLTLKRRLFDREGVREYWIVDPEGDNVAVYRRADDGSFPLAATREARNGETLMTPLLPGWQLALERLFARSG
ncbi:MAG: Uma2 family endonuclease [Acidobacteriota bacterium]|nr:Uma2 family endonuclease [Acidobacteriota bacterium]